MKRLQLCVRCNLSLTRLGCVTRPRLKHLDTIAPDVGTAVPIHLCARVPSAQGLVIGVLLGQVLSMAASSV